MATGTASFLKRVAPDNLKELSRPGFRAWGRATAGMRAFPDFLVIGTKRGGTTSMIKYLRRHPSILPMWPGVENAKKTFYFDENYHRGDAWYRSHFPSELQRRRVEKRTGVRPLTGEAAPYYMFHPLVLDRVVETVPQAKIIVLLRNPVDRIWSHYNERVDNGTEPLDFRAALDAEEGRLRGEAERIVAEGDYYSEKHDFCSYLARGRYLEHLEPWLDRFYPEQLHVVRSEDLYRRPQEVLPQVHRFLGLPEVPPPTKHRFNYVPAATVDPDTRAWLAEYYEPHVAALEKKLDRSFQWDLLGGGTLDD
jgi:Sulfotransferase domain